MFTPQQGDLELLRNPFTFDTEHYYITSDPDSIVELLDSIRARPDLKQKTEKQGLNMNVNRYGNSPQFKYFQALATEPVIYFILFDDGAGTQLAGLLIVPPQTSPVVEVPSGAFSYLFNRAMTDRSLPKRLILAYYEVQGYVGDSLVMSGTLKF